MGPVELGTWYPHWDADIEFEFGQDHADVNHKVFLLVLEQETGKIQAFTDMLQAANHWVKSVRGNCTTWSNDTVNWTGRKAKAMTLFWTNIACYNRASFKQCYMGLSRQQIVHATFCPRKWTMSLIMLLLICPSRICPLTRSRRNFFLLLRLFLRHH